MSGDVQPRKRKDKKRKRDFAERKSEGDITLSRQNSLEEDDESSHGVHSTKMGSDDVHLHVQEDHGTGGHWCAKLLFFILLSVLVGLIGLIIMENRGLADLDTPLSESRYSNYFDGWVEERVDDHEHDAVEASIEEHEEHDEPFEEVEDHSEPTEEDADEADEHDDEDEEQEDEADEVDTQDKSENNNNDDDDDDDEGDEEAEANMQESNEPQQNEDDNDDDEEDEDQAAEEEDEEDAEDNVDEDDVTTKERTDSQEVAPDNDDEEEEDEDQMDENSVEIVDNDAQEAELLQEKAKVVDSKEADTEADDDDDNNVDQNDNNDDNDAADTTQSWASAQIKNKAGGPQSYDEELDSFERELRAANEEMMREFSYQ